MILVRYTIVHPDVADVCLYHTSGPQYNIRLVRLLDYMWSSVGVVCLLSSLSFHGVGTQAPSRVWIALDRRARKPTLDWPPTRIVRFGGEALTEGVETHELEGVNVKVYGMAKTLADLFKYRNKVGLDVALEALKEMWRAAIWTWMS